MMSSDCDSDRSCGDDEASASASAVLREALLEGMKVELPTALRDDGDVMEYVVQILLDNASDATDEEGEGGGGPSAAIVETTLEPLLAGFFCDDGDDDDGDEEEGRSRSRKLAIELVEIAAKVRRRGRRRPPGGTTTTTNQKPPLEQQERGEGQPPPPQQQQQTPDASAGPEHEGEQPRYPSTSAPDGGCGRGGNAEGGSQIGGAEYNAGKTEKPKRRSPKREGRRQRKNKKSAVKGGRKKEEGEGEEEKYQLAAAAEEEEAGFEDDDASSAWRDCVEQGAAWGGRGRGGRGGDSGAVNSVKSNVHLSDVSISLPGGGGGADLLSHSTMDIVRGHKYGLIGRNGCGKTTLLRRLAHRAVPGMPTDMRILLVRQQINGSDETSVEVLVRADVDRESLLREQDELERELEREEGASSDEDLEAIAVRLGDVAAELDAISADTAEERAVEILRGLQFTDSMIYGPTKTLSGGWRMRLALARALFVQSDLLLFDECTNHLDLFGLEWLIGYINRDPDRTLIVVSHDRSFLDAVCTDIVVLEHQKLKYHVGNYSEYDRQQREKAARESQILDAADRQKARAAAFIQKQQSAANKKGADPNKQRQAKMMKEKKLDRIGNYREDGKRYKLNSLKKLSEDYVRLAQKVVIEVDEPVIKMNFPNPAWPPGISPNDAIVRLEGFGFSFEGPERPLLRDVTLNVCRGSKVAIVGKNGAGKSSLVKLIGGDINQNDYCSRGSLWRHPNLRIGHVTQYAVEELETYADQVVVEYAEERLRSGKATAEIIAKASGNIRQYLGAFGLGGRHALQKIGKLSGGERMRLCFATVLAEQPHLLILDESTNHVDIETLDSMSDALNSFDGSVLMVSHNQGFLSGFCKELWVIEEGYVTVNHSDTESFDEIFSEYRSSVLRGGGKKSLSARRQEKATMAKRATEQRSGARQNTALL